MKKVEEQIVNRAGNKLAATLYVPILRTPNYYVLFVNCFTCSKNLHSTKYICQELVNIGFGVLSFDFTGLGNSSGEFKDSYFSVNINDVEDAYNFLTEKYSAPVLIIGHSLGGLAAIDIAAKLLKIQAVATIGTPASLKHVTKHFSHGIDAVKEKGEVEIEIGGRPFKINNTFINDFYSRDVLPTIKSLNKPILILHSPIDKVVEIENAEMLFLNSKYSKSFISLDKADHLLQDEKDAVFVGKAISTWAMKCLTEDNLEVKKSTPEGEEIVAHLDLTQFNFTTTVETKKHSYIVDEPGKLGGDAKGPAPYDLLLGALAACTAMTIKVYAERSGWKLRTIDVFASHKKEYSEDMDKKGFVEKVLKRIYINGNISEEQRKRLVHIASTCPVHKTLENIVNIETETT